MESVAWLLLLWGATFFTRGEGRAVQVDSCLRLSALPKQVDEECHKSCVCFRFDSLL